MSRQIQGRLPDATTSSISVLPESDLHELTNSLSTQPQVATQNHARPRTYPIVRRCMRDGGRRLDEPSPSGAAPPTTTSSYSAVTNLLRHEGQEFQVNALKKIATRPSLPPAPMEFRFSPEDLGTVRVGWNRSSTNETTSFANTKPNKRTQWLEKHIHLLDLTKKRQQTA